MQLITRKKRVQQRSIVDGILHKHKCNPLTQYFICCKVARKLILVRQYKSGNRHMTR